MSTPKSWADVVYTPGCWDLLHVGHIRHLTKASQWGRLIVGVASDAVILEDKGAEPVIPEAQRLEMVRALGCVFRAYTYDSLEFLTHLRLYRPSTLAVSTTWGHDERHKAAEKWCEENGAKVRFVAYTPGVSTSLIRERAKR